MLPTRGAVRRARRRPGEGLSSPELATLLAHTKLDLTAQVLASDLPDAPAFAGRLPEYFPRARARAVPRGDRAHPLRREIVTTMLVNEMVDGGGITYAFRLGEELSAGAADAVRAYAVATVVFDLPALWERMRDPAIPTAVSDAIILESRRLLDRASRWLLTNRPQPLAVGSAVARFSRGDPRRSRPRLPELLQGRERQTVLEHADELQEAGVDAEWAMKASAIMYGYSLLDVVDLTELAERDREPREPPEVAALYYGLSEHLGIDLALTSVSALERGDRWHALARLALRDDLYGSLRAITLDALREAAPGTPVPEAIGQWEQANASRLVRARAALHEVSTAGQLDLATSVRGLPPAAGAGALVGCFVTQVPLRWTDQDAYRHLNHASAVTVLGGGPHRPVLRSRRRGRTAGVRGRVARRRAERRLPATGGLPLDAAAGRDDGRRDARGVVPDPVRAPRRAQ